MTGLDKLQEIGAHKIYEKTHIAKRYVEDILNGKFSSMNKIQFTGFISIIEREYNIDLHELKEAYAEQFETDPSKEKEPFVVSQHEESKTEMKTKGIYIISALVIMGVIVFLIKPSSQEKVPASKPKVVQPLPIKNELNNTTIEKAKFNLNTLDKDSAAEKVGQPKEEVRVEPVVHISKFEIIPRSKLWIGIIDLETFERRQKLGSSSFELDKDKDWLLVMGHGFVNFEVNGEEKKFKDEKKVWFAYENGVLSKLSRSEFKEKNRGKAW